MPSARSSWLSLAGSEAQAAVWTGNRRTRHPAGDTGVRRRHVSAVAAPSTTLAISPGPRLGSRPPFQPHALIRFTCCRCDVQLVAMWQSCNASQVFRVTLEQGDMQDTNKRGPERKARQRAICHLNLTRKSTFVPSQIVLVYSSKVCIQKHNKPNARASA